METPRKVAVTGASGLIGTAVVESLAADGWEVWRLVRRAASPERREISWRPEEGTIERDRLEGFAAVVHLAGENIAERWTADRKARIRDSRVHGTRLLAGALAELERPPRVLVSGSAVGYYGDRNEEELDEDSPPGTGFLSDIAVEWEDATEAAAAAGTRVALVRTGMVLSPRGGALARMIPPFRLGVGGRIGSGRQWVAWITLHDLVAVVRFLIDRDDLEGAFNAVAPTPVRNEELTRELAAALGRPALFPVPGAALRLLFGEMADAVLLTSQRAVPRRLLAAGFRFRHPELRSALRAELAHAG